MRLRAGLRPQRADLRPPVRGLPALLLAGRLLPEHGDFNSAIRMFNIEEKHGARSRSDALYRSSAPARGGGVSAGCRPRTPTGARAARAEVAAAAEGGGRAARARKFDEALDRLAQAADRGRGPRPRHPAVDRRARDKIAGRRRAPCDEADDAGPAAGADPAGGHAPPGGETSPPRPSSASTRSWTWTRTTPAPSRARRTAQERILRLHHAGQPRGRLPGGQGPASRPASTRRRSAPLTDAAADPTNVAGPRAAGAGPQDHRGPPPAEGPAARGSTRLLADGERLLGRAQVSPRPGSAATRCAGARQGPTSARWSAWSLAERMTGEALLREDLAQPAARPDLPRAAASARPRSTAPTAAVVGVATDDRGIAKIEFRVGGRLAGRDRAALRPGLAGGPAQPALRARAGPGAGAERDQR